MGAGPAVSFGVIESVLGEALGGLVGGYGCVEGYAPREVVLRSGIALEGFFRFLYISLGFSPKYSSAIM